MSLYEDEDKLVYVVCATLGVLLLMAWQFVLFSPSGIVTFLPAAEYSASVGLLSEFAADGGVATVLLAFPFGIK